MEDPGARIRLEQRALGYSQRSLSHAEIKDVNGVPRWRAASLRALLRTLRFIEVLVHIRQVCRVDRLHPEKIHSHPICAIRSPFFSPINSPLICATQGSWASAAMMSRNQRLRPVLVYRKIIIDKKDRDLSPIFAARRFSNNNS